MQKFCSAMIAALMLALAGMAWAQVPKKPPPTEPFLRIETGMHSGIIKRIGVDAACHLMVTGSYDKTARLWRLPANDIGKPTALHVLRVPIGPGNDGKIYAVAMSPDGRWAAAGGWDSLNSNGVYVFDTATGRLLHRLGQLPNVIDHLVFSDDGSHLAATLGGGAGMRVWDTSTWQVVGTDTKYGGRDSYGAAFDHDGRLYTVADDGYLRRYGTDFKRDAPLIKTFGGAQPYSVAVSPDGAHVAIGYYDRRTVDVYNARTLERLFSPDMKGVYNGNVDMVTWSPDGTRLYAGGTYGPAEISYLRIWNKGGHGKPVDIPLTRSTIFQLLPCGHDAIAVGAGDPAFGLVSLSGKHEVWEEGAVPDLRAKLGSAFMVSADGSKVRFGLGFGGKMPVTFDLATNHLSDGSPTSDLFPPDITSLKLSSWQDNTKPKLNGKVIPLKLYEISRSVAIAPDHERFVLGAEWSLRCYTKTGKLLWIKEVPGASWGVNITRNGKYVVAAHGDGTIRWYRLSDGQEVLALFVNTKTREWVLWTPQGYYASSVAGDRQIGWQINKGWTRAPEFVTAARLKKHLYRPDIVKNAFKFADAGEAIRKAGLSGFKLGDLVRHAPPVFHIETPGDNTHAITSPVSVKISVAASDDPVTGFDVTVNGRQVTPRAVRALSPVPEPHTRTLNIPLEQGTNKIKIVAHNAVGDSIKDVVVYLDHKGALNAKGKLYVLAIGVDKYPNLGPENSLHFASADAKLLLDTLKRKAAPLHTQVIAKLLVSGGPTPPTAANIQDALLMFREAGPKDTVVLFLAGHGVNDGPNYLFMPQDADYGQGKFGKYWRPSTVVRWSELEQALQQAQGSRVMFVDTCHSGNAYSSRLVKDAADANIVVFSATDGPTLAQELPKLGHGVFTYAVNKGLEGAADPYHTGTVNILELGAYVSREVQRLTNREQDPTYNLSGVKDFALTMR